jgi:hypothetical protein
VKKLLRHKEGQRLFINPMGAMPQGLVFAKGGRKRAGDVTPVPLGSKESHDPPTTSGWLRAKSLHLIMIEDKMIEMKV